MNIVFIDLNSHINIYMYILESYISGQCPKLKFKYPKAKVNKYLQYNPT